MVSTLPSKCLSSLQLKGNPDIRFVFINLKEGLQVVEEFLAQQQLSLHNNLSHSARVDRAVGSLSLPTTLFYSADGLLKNNHLGELSR